MQCDQTCFRSANANSIPNSKAVIRNQCRGQGYVICIVQRSEVCALHTHIHLPLWLFWLAFLPDPSVTAAGGKSWGYQCWGWVAWWAEAWTAQGWAESTVIKENSVIQSCSSEKNLSTGAAGLLCRLKTSGKSSFCHKPIHTQIPPWWHRCWVPMLTWWGQGPVEGPVGGLPVTPYWQPCVTLE